MLQQATPLAVCRAQIRGFQLPCAKGQVQVSRELLALSVLKRDPLGAEDSSDSSPLTPLPVRGSLGEADGATSMSQLEAGGIMRQGVHPGGDEPATHRCMSHPACRERCMQP